MGVSITAYSNLTLTDPHDYNDETCYEEGHIEAFAYAGFEQSLRGVVDHDKVTEQHKTRIIGGRCYAKTDATREHEILAMSHGGYNRWREALSMAVLAANPQAVWDDPDTYRDRPFFEIVNFADNEGTIGPDAAADLLADFQANQQWRGNVLIGSVMRWQEVWDSWITGLTLAAQSGLIEYA